MYTTYLVGQSFLPGKRIAQRCLAVRIRILDRLLSRRYDEVMRPLGLKATQLNLLAALSLSQPTSAAELGRLLSLEKSTTSRNLALLEKSEWIRHGPEGLCLTQQGEVLLTQAEQRWSVVQQAFEEQLGPDAVALLDGLIRKLR